MQPRESIVKPPGSPSRPNRKTYEIFCREIQLQGSVGWIERTAGGFTLNTGPLRRERMIRQAFLIHGLNSLNGLTAHWAGCASKTVSVRRRMMAGIGGPGHGCVPKSFAYLNEHV